MSAVPNQLLSESEYFEIELHSPVRHDFYLGEMFAMSGTSKAHETILKNLNKLFADLLFDTQHDYFSGNMKIRNRGGYSYADAAVTSGEAILEKHEGTDILVNPSIIVEVLSESTADYDRGLKFDRYKAIASFVEYVLIDQFRMLVEHHVKSPAGSWKVKKYKQPSDAIGLESVDMRIPLVFLYQRVTFTSA